MSGPLTSVLVGDHARLDGLLRRAMTAASPIDLAVYAAFRADLLRHIGLEETILLPAAQRWQGGQSGPTQPLPQWGVKPTRAALASPAHVMAIATWDEEHEASSGDVWMEGFCHLFT